MIRQNYKVNRKTKEEADKTQVNYRSSDSDPISIIKRVYIYITDKKGNIIPEVTITIDGTEIKTGYHGLLVSNFPNEEKSITASKEGYKPATASIILNAEVQTHEFYLALTTDDDESTVISTDNTQPENNDNSDCETLFELNDNDELVTWSTRPNEIIDGVYTGHGSYVARGWSNEGLWQLDYDIKYNRTGSYTYFYVGPMPFCSAEINPYTDEKMKKYAFVAWEKSAQPYGMDSICLEGPANYKYNNAEEYHHTTIKKVAEDRIEYYFDNQKWVFAIPNLANLETLHIGIRDNAYSRNQGATLSYKNIKVIGLCPEPVELNDTVQVDEIYEFKSFGNEEGTVEWGEGTVQIKSLPENEDDLYIEVEVKTNSPDDSFVGQTFYILKNATVGNKIYPLYSDKLGTETGIYVLITSLYVEPIELNETVQIDDVYEFKSFGDETGETEWGEGTVQIKSLPENEDDLYIEVEVKTNSPDDSFVGQTFYILKNATVGNKIYPLYSDNNGTETGIYVSINNQVEQTEEEIENVQGLRFIDSEGNPLEGIEVSLIPQAPGPYVSLLSNNEGYIIIDQETEDSKIKNHAYPYYQITSVYNNDYEFDSSNKGNTNVAQEDSMKLLEQQPPITLKSKTQNQQQNLNTIRFVNEDNIGVYDIVVNFKARSDSYASPTPYYTDENGYLINCDLNTIKENIPYYEINSRFNITSDIPLSGNINDLLESIQNNTIYVQCQIIHFIDSESNPIKAHLKLDSEKSMNSNHAYYCPTKTLDTSYVPPQDLNYYYVIEPVRNATVGTGMPTYTNSDEFNPESYLYTIQVVNKTLEELMDENDCITLPIPQE